MENVLEIYRRPYNIMTPVVCMDEARKQLVKEICEPLSLEPGQPIRYDYNYERNGVGDIFMFFEPLVGRRHVEIRQNHAMEEWVKCMKILADEFYPDAEKIVVIMDNLRTHQESGFYEYLPPEEARRLLNRFEFHFTPKHGSWLNMAEIALSVLNKECLDRRIPDLEFLKKEIAVWEKTGNEKKKTIDWQFTCDDARVKLRRLYPNV